MASPEVRVYTDGACLGNPGPGGFGVRIRFPDGRIKEFGGGEDHTTNNRMELTAVIRAILETMDEEKVRVVTDSEYVRLGITSWLKGWKARGWLTRDKKPVSNLDLWKEMDRILRPGLSFAYTAGHAGDPDNERCDRIAVSFARGAPISLMDGVDKTPFAPLKRKPANKGGAVIYLSYVNGELQRHATWAECEATVKGQSGARFKKCRGPEEEATVLEQWGVRQEENGEGGA